MLRQGNLGGELFSRTILGTTVAESVTSSKRKKQRQEKIDDQTKVCWSILLLLWSICSYFQQQHSLEEELASLKKTLEKFWEEFQLPVRHKTFRNSIPKKSEKIKQNKTFRFFNSFSQNSSFAEEISKEKEFHSTWV